MNVSGQGKESCWRLRLPTFGLFFSSFFTDGFADSKIVHYLHKKAQRLKEEKWFCQLSGSGKDSHRSGFALQRFPERHMLGRVGSH